MVSERNDDGLLNYFTPSCGFVPNPSLLSIFFFKLMWEKSSFTTLCLQSACHTCLPYLLFIGFLWSLSYILCLGTADCCANNEWLQRLYSIRESLIPVYNRSDFFAGMNAIQRSESINSIKNIDN
ncbi:transmembrane protein, putative [Medicago truncatula]|uniref:Transmembrane protein, putative n=1 Tax=Medicago truncatula TaxID=3880 RepID=G7ZX03_MEDTR|nr:transmembrane protein, putative [Medicago truncatula]